MNCTEMISNIHAELKLTGRFDNLFDCISEDKVISSECRSKRLDFEDECNLFVITVNSFISLEQEVSGYKLAEKVIPCFSQPTDFWGVCDTAVEEHKEEEYCMGLCHELNIHSEL